MRVPGCAARGREGALQEVMQAARFERAEARRERAHCVVARALMGMSTHDIHDLLDCWVRWIDKSEKGFIYDGGSRIRVLVWTMVLAGLHLWADVNRVGQRTKGMVDDD